MKENQTYQSKIMPFTFRKATTDDAARIWEIFMPRGSAGKAGGHGENDNGNPGVDDFPLILRTLLSPDIDLLYIALPFISCNFVILTHM